MMSSGLTRRRAGGGSNGGLDSSSSNANNTHSLANDDDNLDAGTASWSPLDDDRFDKRPPMSKRGSENNVNGNQQQNVFETYDGDDDDEADKGKKGGSKGKYKLTLLEEVLLLGLKDAQGYLSFWNDNISYVLRGCILIELSLRNRIRTVSEIRKRPFSDRLIEVIDERPTGEVLLDEALKLMKLEKQSVGNWIDLLSGETWNLMKIGYQLKQVRERIAKGLVDKGVLRTEKKNFVLFDMATHPVADHTSKEQILQRVINTLLGRSGTTVSTNNLPNLPSANPAGMDTGLPDRRTVALLCAAYAANVLDNALVNLSFGQREQCYRKVDDLMQEFAAMTERAKAVGGTEIMAGVLNVYLRMDSII